MTPEQVAKAVSAASVGQALLECAQRTRTRFGLRGGIVRNLLMQDEPNNLDLFAFVDPFSDIDVVVNGREDWNRLAEVIGAVVPFAGFYRWEAITEDLALEWLRQSIYLPSDRSVVWFDGLGRRPNLSVTEFLNVPTENELNAQDAERLLARYSDDAIWVVIKDYLKFLRLRLRRGGADQINPDLDFMNAYSSYVENRLRRSVETLSARQLLQIDLQFVKLFATAADLTALKHGTSIISRQLISMETRSMMASYINRADETDTRAVGVWRGTKRIHIRAASVNAGTLGPGGRGALVPSFTLRSPPPDACCRYQDFKYGPAVVLWRGPGVDNAIAAGESSVVAYPQLSRVYQAPPHSEWIQIPGLVLGGEGLAVRADHAFVGSLFGKPISMGLSVMGTNNNA